MPRYFYQAKNLKGEQEKGVIEAENKHHLSSLLRRKGYFLVSVDQGEEEDKPGKKRLQFKLLGKIKGVSLSDKLFFTKNLEVMIRTGVALPKAFQILSQQIKSGLFREAILNIAESVVKGRSLSASMEDYPKIFPPLYFETVKVGEETGKMEEALSILADQMEREHGLKAKIKAAMVYPMIVLMMAFIIGIFMMIFAVPRLKEAFEGLGVDLPLTTRALLGFGDFLSSQWPLALVLAGFLAGAVFFALKTKRGNKARSFIILKIPVVSQIVKKTNAALTLRTVSSLLQAGVPVVKSLSVASGALRNYYFKQALADASRVVEKGKKISLALKKYQKIYPSMVVQMMEVGEATGETSGILAKLADFYEEEVASATQKLSSVVEPFLILLVGAVVGFFAVSMMQPMFSIMSGFQ